MDDGDRGGGRRSRRWVGRRTIVIATPGMAVVVVVAGVVIGGFDPTCVLSASARVGVGVVIAPVVIAMRVSASGVRVGVLVSRVGPLAVVGLFPGVGAVALVLVAVARLLWRVAIQS